MKTMQNGLMQIMKKALMAITLIVMFMYSLERVEKLQLLRDKAGILLVCGLGCHDVGHICPDNDHYYGRDDKGHRHLGPDPRRL